jgi:hypothetical protein
MPRDDRFPIGIHENNWTEMKQASVNGAASSRIGLLFLDHGQIAP